MSPLPAAGPLRSSPIPPGSRSWQSGTWFPTSRWGRALPRGSASALLVLQGSWEPHTAGAGPTGPAPQCSHVPRRCPELGSCSPGPFAVWFVRCWGAEQPGCASSGLLGRVRTEGLAPQVPQGQESRAGAHPSSHPRATSAPLSCTPPLLPWSGAAKSLCPLSPVLPQPVAWGSWQSPAVTPVTPVTGVFSAQLRVRGCGRCCKHPPVSDDLSGCSAGAEDSVIPPPLRARSGGQATCAGRLRARLLGERCRPSRPHAAPRRYRCCQEHGPAWAPASLCPQHGQGARRVTKNTRELMGVTQFLLPSSRGR